MLPAARSFQNVSWWLSVLRRLDVSSVGGVTLSTHKKSRSRSESSAGNSGGGESAAPSAGGAGANGSAPPSAAAVAASAPRRLSKFRLPMWCAIEKLDVARVSSDIDVGDVLIQRQTVERCVRLDESPASPSALGSAKTRAVVA